MKPAIKKVSTTMKSENAAEKPHYRRRRYRSDVVIYTKESGHFLTVLATDWKDPWQVAGIALYHLNNQ